MRLATAIVAKKKVQLMAIAMDSSAIVGIELRPASAGECCRLLTSATNEAIAGFVVDLNGNKSVPVGV